MKIVHTLRKSLSIYLSCLFYLLTLGANAQVLVTYTVNTQADVRPISPMIYGANELPFTKARAIRLGGNRMTGYNWETNASNAGEDWHNSSDDFLPWNLHVPPAQYDSTAIVWSTFLNHANRYNQYALLTIPMAGYVAADKSGTVEPGQTAPSSRWNVIKNNKPSGLTLTPDLTDGKVYSDESIYFMMEHFGDASSKTGVKAYELDNEPGLWQSTHPRLHPNKVTVEELLTRSSELATTIKRMDPNALVFGPALYGFAAFLELQEAPDWDQYKDTYSWFISAYLDAMRKESSKVSQRLLDVLDVHWYPEPPGVYSGDTSRTAAINRMQCVRSLWDSSYVEDSWIGKWFSPVALLPHLKHSIDKNYPGTKIAITEYNYAGNNHISGGIAQIEALGTFAEQGVYFASKWAAIDGFVAAGYNMFLDYDGQGSAFGDIHVASNSSDYEKSSIFSSVESQDSTLLHLIITNKDYDHPVQAEIHILSSNRYHRVDKYILSRRDTNILKALTTQVDSNTFEVRISPLSAVHLILHSDPPTGTLPQNDFPIFIHPNPASNLIHLRSSSTNISEVNVYDLEGRLVFRGTYTSKSLGINSSGWSNGCYIMKVRMEDGKLITKTLSILHK